MYRHTRTCVAVWRGVGCGGWRGSPRTSLFVRGHRVELQHVGPLAEKRQKTVESQAKKTTSGVPGFHPAKAGTKSFEPMAGLGGCVLYLLLRVFTCFSPQTDQVDYLLLAAVQQKAANLVQGGRPRMPAIQATAAAINGRDIALRPLCDV